MGWPGRQGSPPSIRAVGELLATPAFGRGFLSHPATSALELYGGGGVVVTVMITIPASAGHSGLLLSCLLWVP